MIKYLLIIFLFISLSSLAQDKILIKHTNYISLFSTTLYYPLYVEWWETTAKLKCKSIVRKNDFKSDPLYPKETSLSKDYLNSGYDKGHMCPDEDNRCQGQSVQDECFYFSNMAPQPHDFNGGIWKSLEIVSQKIAIAQDSVHVWAGSIGVVKKIGKVSVPEKCWKVLYIKKTNQYLAYIFNDVAVPEKGKYLKSYQVDVSVITNRTGFTFN